MDDNRGFDFFALFIVLCLSISCCMPNNHGIERKLDNISSDIQVLNKTIVQLVDEQKKEKEMKNESRSIENDRSVVQN